MYRFGENIILVTGAARGIGLATARRFVEEGGTVYAADVDANRLEREAGALGDRYKPVVLDVTSEAAARCCLDRIAKAEGKLDCLVNNAGINRPQFAAKLERADVEAVAQVNLIAPMLLTRLAVSLLENSSNPSVVNVSAVSAWLQFRATAIYSASKAGLEAFTRVCAKELPAIRFNAVLPGFTRTRVSTRRHDIDDLDELVPAVSQIPLRRWATPDEIAGPILFLASRDASYITGASLVIDVGLCASSPIGA